ncbi:hypothetical protein QYE76_052219 [Lolium multiflorum]|uniref:Uncharacterized protein n=1 Tax=Lolium multiflorum TaxID=4521 RepID=A0AAD8WLC2_LOLMU|nr:hypothetical protein QYE76_052219 [Lolium multiflorum]
MEPNEPINTKFYQLGNGGSLIFEHDLNAVSDFLGRPHPEFHGVQLDDTLIRLQPAGGTFMSITLGVATKLLDDMMINYSEWHTERAPQGKKVNSVEESSSLSDKIDVIMSMLVNGRSNEQSGNNYRPYPSANGNGYGNSYGNSYNNNRSVPPGLEAMLKEFISTQTAFNKSVEEKLDKIDILASRVDRLASDVDLLKLKVMPNNDIDNKITTTANAIQVRINENIRLMAELRARWDREENEKLAKENNVAKVWTITTKSNVDSSHVAAPPTINDKIIGVGNVSTPSAKRAKLPEIAKTAETACDKAAEIFSNLGDDDPIAVAHNDLDFDDCHIYEVIKFLQKLAKSPNASTINLAFTKHITNALIKAREEKLKRETSIPRKLEDGWEPIIKMRVNNFDCNALCDLGASISVMPKKVYDMLDLPPLKNCYLDVNLADNAKKKPLGRVDNVHIVVNNNLVPVDFVVLDIECNASCPIILGRPFLRTVGATIDMKEGSTLAPESLVLRRTTSRRHQPSTCLAPPGSINLGFFLRKTCRCAHHTFLLGFPTDVYIYAHHTPGGELQWVITADLRGKMEPPTSERILFSFRESNWLDGLARGLQEALARLCGQNVVRILASRFAHLVRRDAMGVPMELQPHPELRHHAEHLDFMLYQTQKDLDATRAYANQTHAHIIEQGEAIKLLNNDRKSLRQQRAKKDATIVRLRAKIASLEATVKAQEDQLREMEDDDGGIDLQGGGAFLSDDDDFEEDEFTEEEDVSDVSIISYVPCHIIDDIYMFYAHFMFHVGAGIPGVAPHYISPPSTFNVLLGSYWPYPYNNGNGYGNTPPGLEAMLKEFISTQTAFNKSVEEKLGKIDILASKVDSLAADVDLLKSKVMPNENHHNKIVTTANSIQVRINENIRLMAELRARWEREENEKEDNIAKVWTITTTSNANATQVAAPPTNTNKRIGVSNVSTSNAKREKLPETAKTAETACDKTAEIFSNIGDDDPIALDYNGLNFDDCHISEVIKFLQKLAKSPNASAINLAFTQHITNALIKTREEKLEREASIPRKLEDGWEPIIKMKVNDFDCNALCDLGASISVMPKKIYNMLNLPPLKNCYLDVNLADHSTKKPLGKVDNVRITVNNNLVPVDFVVLDIECNASCPIILGRPFLRTVGAIIDMKEGRRRLSERSHDFEEDENTEEEDYEFLEAGPDDYVPIDVEDEE